MGNSLPNNGRTELGSNATINFKVQEHTKSVNGNKEESWVMSYIIDGSVVRLILERIFDRDGKYCLRFQCSDSTHKGCGMFFFIDRAEKGLLQQIDKFSNLIGKFYDTEFDDETYDFHWGGITKTNAFFHANGRGLLVVQQKRKNGDMKPCMVTVAHYYAYSSGRNGLTQNKIDIGLSMVVDVWVSNNEFVLSAEGPIQHSSFELLYMFQEISRTKNWKRTSCPHRAETQRLPAESGSEGRNNLPPRLHGPIGHNAARRSLLNNETIVGNGNGNYIIAPREINNYHFYNQRGSDTETESESEDENNLVLARPNTNRRNYYSY